MADQCIASDVFQHLQKATASDPAELAGLYREYLAEGRRALTQMHGALEQKNGEHFCERAHYLRGSSLIVGATVVARCCANLEMMGRNSEFREAARLLDQTSAALADMESELAKRLGLGALPAGSAA